MAPLITLICLLAMAMAGFVFDVYLFSRGALGHKYGRQRAFTRPVSTGPLMNDTDDYPFIVCSDGGDDRSQRARTFAIVLCAGVIIIGMVAFMLINSFA